MWPGLSRQPQDDDPEPAEPPDEPPEPLGAVLDEPAVPAAPDSLAEEVDDEPLDDPVDDPPAAGLLDPESPESGFLGAGPAGFLLLASFRESLR